MTSEFEPRGISVAEEVRHGLEEKTIKSIMEAHEKRDEKGKQKFQRLTPRQWSEIETLWKSGEITLAELSQKYGKDKTTFINHFRKTGIKKGENKEEIARMAQKVAEEKAKTEAAILSDRIRRTKEEHYKYSEAIAKLTFKQVLEANNEGRQFRTISQDVKALLLAAETLKKVREERWVTLGLDKDVVDPDELPELVMSTMTEEQVEQLRNMQREDEEEMGLNDDDLILN